MVTHINHYTEHITNRYTYHSSTPFQNEAEQVASDEGGNLICGSRYVYLIPLNKDIYY